MAFLTLPSPRRLFSRGDRTEFSPSVEPDTEPAVMTQAEFTKQRPSRAEVAALAGTVRGLLDGVTTSDQMKRHSLNIVEMFEGNPGDHGLRNEVEILAAGLRLTVARNAAEAAVEQHPATSASGDLYQAALTYNTAGKRDPAVAAILEGAFGAQALADQIAALPLRADAERQAVRPDLSV